MYSISIPRAETILNHMLKGAFDSHWLEEVNFDLEFHGSSAYKNLSQTIKGLFRPFYKERENTI